jgi:hypothetical protein
MRGLRRWFVLFLLATPGILCPAGFACSLAIHDWHLLWSVRVPVDAAVLPLAEIDLLHHRLAHGHDAPPAPAGFSQPPASASKTISHVFWVARHSLFSALLSGVISMLVAGDDVVPVVPVAPGTPVGSLVRVGPLGNRTPMVLGTDQGSLRLALFADRNSNDRCFQVVLLESKRIRAVHAPSGRPWAQETMAQSWISLIFFRFPLPESLLSISFTRLTKRSPIFSRTLNSLKPSLRAGI